MIRRRWGLLDVCCVVLVGLARYVQRSTACVPSVGVVAWCDDRQGSVMPLIGRPRGGEHAVLGLVKVASRLEEAIGWSPVWPRHGFRPPVRRWAMSAARSASVTGPEGG